MKVFLQKIAIFLVFFIPSCSPIIQDNVNDEQRLWRLMNQVNFAPIDGKTGQRLKQRLEASFNVLGKSAKWSYELQIELEMKDIDYTERKSYEMNARIALRELETQEIILTGKIYSSSKYISSGSDYQQEKSREFAKQRALNELVKKITLRMESYFRKKIADNDL